MRAATRLAAIALVFGLVFGLGGTASMAVAQQTGGARGEGALIGSYGDWEHRCDDVPGSNAKRCFIIQSAVEAENKVTILQVAVGFEGPSKNPTMIVTSPLGMMLPEGVLLQIDDDPVIKLQYELCMPGGCISLMKLDGDTLGKLKAGAKLRVAFKRPDGRLVAVPISLQGFTAAITALSK